MTLVKHELRQGKTAFLIWTGSIALLMAVCICLFPEMKEEMEGVSKLFSTMGAFTAAFGMDRLNFGSLIGYYAIECGNVLGLGGAFYSALCAADLLSKEERNKTAEFLLTHPVSRRRVVTEKLAAAVIQILVLNILVYFVSIAAIALIGESIPWKHLNLLHAAYTLMQLELAGICFGISAYTRRGSAGIGMGVAAVSYCINLIANISRSGKFLKYITPFGYCDGADIVADGRLNAGAAAFGILLCLAGIAAAYGKYLKKDIQ